VGEELSLNINWETTLETGVPVKIEIFDDTTNVSSTPKPFKTYNILGQNFSGSMTVPYKVTSDGYIRLKLSTLSPIAPLTRVAYTNPIFISTKGASLDRKYPTPIGGEFVTLDPSTTLLPMLTETLSFGEPFMNQGETGISI